MSVLPNCSLGWPFISSLTNSSDSGRELVYFGNVLMIVAFRKTHMKNMLIVTFNLFIIYLYQMSDSFIVEFTFKKKWTSQSDKVISF